MHDFTQIRAELKRVTEYRRAVKAAYRLPHGSAAFQHAKELACCHYRDQNRAWAAALHYAYAEARGRQHGAVPSAVWARQHRGGRSLLLENARKLITERLVAAAP